MLQRILVMKMRVERKNKSLVFFSDKKLTILIDILKELNRGYSKFRYNIVKGKAIHEKSAYDNFYPFGGYFINAFKHFVIIGKIGEDRDIVMKENEFREVVEKWKLNSI